MVIVQYGGMSLSTFYYITLHYITDF